ncbi:hypothetical protein GcM1_246048 [Golovinomyces cichoracearum]|uniref:Uncharacterized protein n=1 Tax=Golovinomyces cichoracearum TaxID=62708 RepID=A0A420IE60_9PEZI|nr:hypothetical protein GcM1_246048 [Golovinomyces cichoracearum]
MYDKIAFLLVHMSGNTQLMIITNHTGSMKLSYWKLKFPSFQPVLAMSCHLVFLTSHYLGYNPIQRIQAELIL